MSAVSHSNNDQPLKTTIIIVDELRLAEILTGDIGMVMYQAWLFLDRLHHIPRCSNSNAIDIKHNLMIFFLLEKTSDTLFLKRNFGEDSHTLSLASNIGHGLNTDRC